MFFRWVLHIFNCAWWSINCFTRDNYSLCVFFFFFEVPLVFLSPNLLVPMCFKSSKMGFLLFAHLFLFQCVIHPIYISCSLVLFSCLYADLASVNLIPKTIFPCIQFCCLLTYLVYINNVTNVSVKIKERATNLGILLVKDSYLILLFNNQPSMIKLNMRKLWCILDMVTFFSFQ